MEAIARLAGGTTAWVILLSMIAACATTPPHDVLSAQDQLRSIEQARLHALVIADGPALDRLHADDFQAISPFGTAFDKAQYLRSIASGHLDYVRWQPGNMQVRVHGTSAALRYKASADVAARGKRLPTMQTWNTAFYERRGGRWVIVWFQVTQISPLAP